MTQDVDQVQGYEMTVDYGWKRSCEENIQNKYGHLTNNVFD